MADNENKSDDEYEYDPLELGEENQDVYSEDKSEPPLPTLDERQQTSGPPIVRNSLIVLAGLAVLFIGYRVISAYVSKEKPAESTIAQKPAIVHPQPTLVEPVKPFEQPKPLPTVETSDSQKKMAEQLVTVQNNQQNLQNQVSSLNSELSTVNSTILALTKQIENLNQTVLTLSDKMADESSKISELTLCAKRPKMVKIVPKKAKIIVPRIYYHLQAIIPGRAWLIATNGSTLTIREGSIVPGYGAVRLIDAMQGRVLMQSGQVIEFSQQDS